MRYDEPMTAEQAIELSIREDRTVCLRYTVEVGAELTLLADDCAEHELAEPRLDEYWGTTDDGDTWRVDLYGEEE